MSGIERVRIMVLGDSGVGKTSFVHLAAYNEPIKSPSWTIGCSVEVKIHEFKEGTKEQKTYFVEFWDVGGSNNHRNTRPVFYKSCHGIILVHDLTNRKSEDHLNKWLKELLDNDSNSSLKSVSSSNFNEVDCENFLGSSQMPVLVIGTKFDQMDEKKSTNGKFANQFGTDHIILDCRQARYLAAGTSNAVKLSRFCDKVIETKLYSQDTSFTNRFYSFHQD